MIRVAIVEDDAEVQGVLQEYVRRYTRQYGTEFEVTGLCGRRGYSGGLPRGLRHYFFWMWR